MAAEWHYKTEANEELGPFTPAELKRLASHGRINHSTMVRKGIDGRWVAASKVKGLVDSEAVRPTTTAQAQVVRTPPPKPPSIESNNDPNSHSFPDPRLQPKRDPVDSEASAVAKPKGVSSTSLVGASVVGTLLAVVLIGLGVMSFSKQETTSPSQVIQNTAENDLSPIQNIKNQENPPDTVTAAHELPQATSRPELSSPQSVVKAYLAARTWEDRLPLVLNADILRPEMATYYDGQKLPSDGLLPGNIVTVDNETASVGEKCMVIADLHITTPDRPNWTFAVIHTEEGFKVDWKETQVIAANDIKAAAQKEPQELIPLVEFEVQRCNLFTSDSTKVEGKITNNSKALLAYVQVAMNILNEKGDYLDSVTATVKNLRAGESEFAEFWFRNVKLGDVASWKMSLKDVSISQEGKARIDATDKYELRYSIAGSDNGHRIELEKCLCGHWLETRLEKPCHYFFSSTAPECVLYDGAATETKSIEVVQRNYSSGTLTLRLVDEERFGVELVFSQLHTKVLRVKATHVSNDGGGYFEARKETKDSYDGELQYVGAEENTEMLNDSERAMNLAAPPENKLQDVLAPKNTNGNTKSLASLTETYARTQLDINTRGNILLTLSAMLDTIKSADKRSQLMEQTQKIYENDDSQLLQADLEILQKLEVAPEWEEMHATFTKYLEAAIAVEREAPNFFGSFSFTDVRTTDSRGKPVLRSPKVSVDEEMMSSFKEAQKKCNEAASEWGLQWKQIVKAHGAALRHPKSWEVYVFRVNKSNTKNKK